MSDLTIILPIKNRTKFIDRCLKNIALFNDCPVLVVDASKTSNQAYFETLENVEYFYVPHFSFIDQCAFGAKKSKTKYSIVATDDDFIVSDFICDGIDFLNNNPNYSAVLGSTLRFHEDCSLDYAWSYSHCLDFNSHLNCQFKNLSNGFGFFTDRFIGPFHSLFRTDVLVSVLDTFVSYPEFQDIKSIDRSCCLFTLPHGPIKLLSIISHVRSSGESVWQFENEILGEYLYDKLSGDCEVLDKLFGVTELDRDSLLLNIFKSEGGLRVNKPWFLNFVYKLYCYSPIALRSRIRRFRIKRQNRKLLPKLNSELSKFSNFSKVRAEFSEYINF